MPKQLKVCVTPEAHAALLNALHAQGPSGLGRGAMMREASAAILLHAKGLTAGRKAQPNHPPTKGT